VVASKKISPGRLYFLEPKFERALAYLLCCRPALYARVGVALQVDRLSQEVVRHALQAARLVFLETGRGPTSHLILAQRLQSMRQEGHVTHEHVSAVAAMLDDVDDGGTPDEASVAKELIPVLRRIHGGDVIDKLHVAHVAHENISQLLSQLQGTQRIGEEVGGEAERGGLDAASVAAIGAAQTHRRMPTGIWDLDQVLGGGITVPGLGCVVADPAGGKTAFLVQVAVEAALSGVNVFFATLETLHTELLARALANLTGLTIDVVVGGEQVEVLRRLGRLNAAKTLGRLEIVKLLSNVTTRDDVVQILEADEAKRGLEYGLLVIDSMDHLSRAPYDKVAAWDAMTMIYRDQRVWSERRGIVTWTATWPKAGKRGHGRKTAMIDIPDVCGSAGKMREANLGVSINGRTLDDPAGDLVYYVMRNRNGPDKGVTAPPARLLSCTTRPH
jgi:KaiC/GvpD/RAD55 family RecA-like ATPase